MNQMLPVSAYKLYPLPGGISLDPVEIPQRSGYYLAQANSSNCAAVDTVYIQLSEVGTLEILPSEECVRVMLSATASGSSLASYLWFNGSTEAVTDTPESGEVWLNANNQEGCGLYDTVDVIFEPLAIEAAEYILTHAGCWNDGAIELLSLTTNQPGVVVNQTLYNTVKKLYKRFCKCTRRNIQIRNNQPERMQSIFAGRNYCVADLSGRVPCVYSQQRWGRR